MKRTILCAAVMSAFATAEVFAAISPYDIETPVGRLVNESLDGFGYSRRNPVVGEIWELASPSMKVLQVVDGGVLVTRGAFPTPDAKNFFVKTSRSYADDDILATGYYRAVGTISYTSVLGAQRTVYAFSELSQDQSQTINAIRQDKAAIAEAQHRAAAERRQRAEQSVEFKKSKERIVAEETAEKERLAREKQERENAAEIAKLNAEKDNRIATMKAAAEEEANRQKAEHAREMARLAREREEQDKENRKRIAAAKAEKRQADAKLAVEIQKERGRYAADALSALDFNFKHHCVIQRSIRKNVRVELVDPEWAKLADLQAKQNWLGLLGAIEGDEYDEFPSEKEIDKILDGLKKKSFRILVKGLRPPVGVRINAKRMSGNSGVYGGSDGWGRLDVHCKDFKNTPMEGTPIEKVKGEEVMLAPLEGKVYIRDSDSDRELEIKPGQSFEEVIAEKADEIEEWLKLN